MLGWAVLAIGLSIEIAYPRNGNIRYMGMFFLACGAYLAMPISIVWVSINSGKGYKRAVTFGAIVNFGTAGAFVSSNVFKSNETPRFHTRFSTGLGMACMGLLRQRSRFWGVFRRIGGGIGRGRSCRSILRGMRRGMIIRILGLFISWE